MKRIFLAEDDMDDQDIFVEMLAEIDNKIHIDVVDNGEKLIALIKTLNDDELPHLLVLDQNMPLLKGSETINALRGMKRYRNIPAVIYSTYHDSKFVEDCKNLQIELILKPDTFKGLKNMISGLVDTYLNDQHNTVNAGDDAPLSHDKYND